MSRFLVLSDTSVDAQRHAVARVLAGFGECLPLTPWSFALDTHVSSGEVTERLKREAGIERGVHVVLVTVPRNRGRGRSRGGGTNRGTKPRHALHREQSSNRDPARGFP